MAGPAVATIQFNNRSVLFGWVWDPDMNRQCRRWTGRFTFRLNRAGGNEAVREIRLRSRRVAATAESSLTSSSWQTR